MRMEGIHCWGVVGREGRGTRGDWGHMSLFLSILPPTISCFQNLIQPFEPKEFLQDTDKVLADRTSTTYDIRSYEH